MKGNGAQPGDQEPFAATIFSISVAVKARAVCETWHGLVKLALPAIAERRDGSYIILGKVTREAIPVEPASPIVGVVADRAGRAICATRDGRILIRGPAGWATAAVRDELPPPRPGSAPATRWSRPKW